MKDDGNNNVVTSVFLVRNMRKKYKKEKEKGKRGKYIEKTKNEEMY